MTSRTDTAGHPDVAEISDLTEGLLPPARTADLRRHLDDCPLCADVYDSLEEIRGLLGTLPGPVRMPAHVAGRIDAALAAEALLSAATSTSESDAANDRASVSRETSTTADALGPGTSPDPGSPSSADRPLGHPRAATGPGRSHHRVRLGRRRTAVIGTVFTAAALGLGAILLQSMGDDSTGKGSQAEAPQESGSTVTFSEGTLEGQVADLLAKSNGTKDRSGGEEPWSAQSADTESGSPAIGTLNTPAVPVPECVQEGTGDSGSVLAAEPGMYKGTSVYLVVQRDTSDSTKVTAYIVDAACVKQDSASPAKLLLTQSYTSS